MLKHVIAVLMMAALVAALAVPVMAQTENPLPYSPEREAAGECRAQGLLADAAGNCIQPPAPPASMSTSQLPASGGLPLVPALLASVGILVAGAVLRRSR